MTISLSDLLTIPTREQVETELLDMLEGVGFQPSAWQVGSVPRTLVKAFAQVIVTLYALVVPVVTGAFLSFATGNWLTILAADQYDTTRDPAVATVGTVLLTDGGAGPYAITAGVTRVQTSDGSKKYVATTSGTLTASGTLSVTVQAIEAGSSYNLANNTTLALETDLPGVTVTNPDPGSGSWITTSGADEQSDDSLRAECRAKWGTLGMGYPSDAFKAWAREALGVDVRVVVYDDNPLGPGTARVVAATTTGALSAADLATVDAYLRARKPIGCSTLEVASAAALPTTITATVYVSSAYRTSAETAISAALVALSSATDIGDEVPLSAIYDAMASPDGVTKVTLTSPASDVSLGTDEVPTFTLDITYVEV